MRFLVLLIALLVSRTAFAFDSAGVARAEWRPFELVLAAITLLGTIAAILAWLDGRARRRPVRRIPPRYYQRPR